MLCKNSASELVQISERKFVYLERLVYKYQITEQKFTMSFVSMGGSEILVLIKISEILTEALPNLKINMSES